MRSRPGPMGVMRLWLVIVASVSCLVCGCASHEDAQVISAADSFVFIAPEDADQNTPGTSDTAEVTMVGDCLGIGSTIIFWPYGTRVVNLVPLTIDVPDLGPVQVGDRLEGGTYNRVDPLPAGIDALPPGCRSNTLITTVMTYFPR